MTTPLLLLVPLVLAQAGAPPPPPPQNSDAALRAMQEGQQVAEEQRAEMQAQLQGIGDELAAANEQIAEERARQAAAAEAQARIVAGVNEAYASLFQLETDLAYGYNDDAQALLDRAADALAAANSRDGQLWLAAAQDAIDRSDNYQARVAIGRALRAIAPGSPSTVGY